MSHHHEVTISPRRAVQLLRGLLGRSSHSAQSDVEAPIENFRPATDLFIGRPRLVKKIHKFFSPNHNENESSGEESSDEESNVEDNTLKICAVTGLDGFGSTELALQYYKQYGHCYSNSIWITANSAKSMRASFVQLAAEMRKKGFQNQKFSAEDLTNDESRKQVLGCLYHALTRNPTGSEQAEARPTLARLLVIFDGAASLEYKDEESPGILSFLDLNRDNYPCVLVTSTSRNWTPEDHPGIKPPKVLHLKKLNEETESTQFFQEILPELLPVNNDLQRLVDGHPQAMHQLHPSIIQQMVHQQDANSGKQVKEFLDRCRLSEDNKAEFLRQPLPGVKDTTFDKLSRTIDKVYAESQVAQYLLVFLADKVESLLETDVLDRFQMALQKARNDDSILAALQLLKNASLVDIFVGSEGQRVVDMHPVVKVVVLHRSFKDVKDRYRMFYL